MSTNSLYSAPLFDKAVSHQRSAETLRFYG